MSFPFSIIRRTMTSGSSSQELHQLPDFHLLDVPDRVDDPSPEGPADMARTQLFELHYHGVPSHGAGKEPLVILLLRVQGSPVAEMNRDDAGHLLRKSSTETFRGTDGNSPEET